MIGRTYLEHKLPDGARLIEYFARDRLVGTARIETSPRGTTIRREFDLSGGLIEEQHNHGKLLEFCIIRKFREGRVVEETYFRKRKLISRRTYKKALVEFPDMPEPSEGLVDLAAEMQALLSQERKNQRKEARSRRPDVQRAASLDAFCCGLLDKGEVRDAKEWFAGSPARLGERDRRASRRLLNSIYRLGAVRIWACEIQTEPDGVTGTSHLVVELPTDGKNRAALLKYLSRPAREQGLEGDPDDGQAMAYVKLD